MSTAMNVLRPARAVSFVFSSIAASRSSIVGGVEGGAALRGNAHARYSAPAGESWQEKPPIVRMAGMVEPVNEAEAECAFREMYGQWYAEFMAAWDADSRPLAALVDTELE